tara:strand:+ start:315 stop:962 length:648 start_codon:yes stop_codon:yes gene_type:complete
MTNSVLGVRNIQHTNGTDAMSIDTTGKVTFSNTSVGSNILEKVGGMCDGSTRTTKSGNTLTLPNVTAYQLINTTSYTTVTGSSISYTAPENCIGVLYEFLHAASWNSGSHAIQHYRLYIDGVEPVYARRTHAATYMESKPMCTWYFKIDSSLGSIDTNTGAVPSWTSARSLSWQSRHYGTSNNVSRMHGTQYFDGGGANTFHMPQVWITAFGASS